MKKILTIKQSIRMIGNIPSITGDTVYITRDTTNIYGNIDNCEISDKDR